MQTGVSVRQVAERHEIAESLIYNWRSARRQAAAIASEALEFIPYGAIITTEPAAAPAVSEPQKKQRSVPSPMPPAPEELIRPHPGARPGAIDIDLPSGVRLSVDSYVNEGAGPSAACIPGRVVISLAPGTKVYLASKPVSMRLGFDGLAALVRPLFAVEPYGGHVFLFRSKSGNYLKALHWDGTGLCLFAKRLERSRFVWPPLIEGGVVLTPAQLHC
jgi:hypothetical protein